MRLAALKMAREQPGQTLRPTALVHEAWLRTCGGDLALRKNVEELLSAEACANGMRPPVRIQPLIAPTALAERTIGESGASILSGVVLHKAKGM